MRTRIQEEARFCWWTTADVCKRLKCEVPHVIGLVDSGDLEAIDIGRGNRREIRIHPDSVTAFEQKRKVQPNAA